MGGYWEFIDPFDDKTGNIFVRVEHLARYLYAAQFIRKRKLHRALDCACGNGYGCRALSAEAQAVVGVDANRELLAQGAAAIVGHRINNVELHQADVNHGLPMFADGTFDIVTCFETLEHIEREEQLLTELHRALRRGGWLLLSVPKAGYEPADTEGRPENPYHLRLYEANGLKALLEQHGFAVEKILGQPYTNISRANMESWRRDSGVTAEEFGSYFLETPQSMECFCKLWGWPTEEGAQHSNVLLAVCRRIIII